jgi:hypothetical protein
LPSEKVQAGGEFGGSTERSPVVLRGLGFGALFTVPSTLCQLAWAILGNSGLRKATLFMFLLRATLTGRLRCILGCGLNG